MTDALWILLGLAIGGGIAVAIALRGSRALARARDEAATLSAELEGERAAHATSRESLASTVAKLEAVERARAEDAERQLDDTARRKELETTFQALASNALRSSNAEFLQLAKETLSKTETTHAKELEKRQQAIEHLVKPLGDGLEKLGKFTNEIETKRVEAYGELKSRLETLASTTDLLGRHSNALATALRGSSQARGRWGEIALRNIVEFAGMTEHCDFREQQTDASGNRPDLVVRIPGGGLIPVDAKVPFADYERASRAEEPVERKRALAAHAVALREKVRELAKKDYASQLEGEVDFTVMFVPTEPILSAALEQNPDLYSEALERKVLPATPVTLIALLRTVGVYWQQERMAENAKEVWREARELHKRLGRFSDHLEKVRKGLSSAVDGYNQAVGSYGSRVLPQGRKIEELGDILEEKQRISPLSEIDTALKESPREPKEAPPRNPLGATRVRNGDHPKPQNGDPAEGPPV